jgi:hypothetical protein
MLGVRVLLLMPRSHSCRQNVFFQYQNARKSKPRLTLPRDHQNSHGEFEVKANFIWSSFHSPTIASDPSPEPFDLTRLVAERDQPHMRSASNELGTNIPLTAGKAQASETNLNLGLSGHVLGPVADLPGLIRFR